MLIVRELLLGPRRYSDLSASLPGITTNLLATRLSHLVKEGLAEKVPLLAPARGHAYALTQQGRDLEQPLLAMARWGAAHRMAERGPEDQVDLGWALLSSKNRYRGVDGMVLLEFRVLDEERPRRFQCRMEPDGMEVEEGVLGRADAVLSGPLMAHLQWLFGGDASGLQIDGEPAALERFQAGFAS